MEEKKSDLGFKLDINADVTALGSAIVADNALPSHTINPLPNVELPAQKYFGDELQATLQLPESQLFESSPQKIEPHVKPNETNLGDLSSKIKVVPEDALKRAEQVAKNLELVRKDVESISGQMRNPDNRTIGRDNYEERVTIPAQNLIFINRVARMNGFPDWK